MPHHALSFKTLIASKAVQQGCSINALLDGSDPSIVRTDVVEVSVSHDVGQREENRESGLIPLGRVDATRIRNLNLSIFGEK
jgi:hypothetical protein